MTEEDKVFEKEEELHKKWREAMRDWRDAVKKHPLDDTKDLYDKYIKAADDHKKFNTKNANILLAKVMY